MGCAECGCERIFGPYKELAHFAHCSILNPLNRAEFLLKAAALQARVPNEVLVYSPRVGHRPIISIPPSARPIRVTL